MYHLKGTPGTYRLITCTLLVPNSGVVNIWSADDVALLEQLGFVRFDPQAEEEIVEPDGKIADEDGPAEPDPPTDPPAPPTPPASRAKRK
jgi:allophanate hydrolase subunit 1